MFQEEVTGDHVRLYVVEDAVVAAGRLEISPEQPDYRASRVPPRPIEPTDVERHAAVAATRACGMVYSALDAIRQSDGKTVFVDINPAPMFAGFSQATGADIVGCLARSLVARCQ
jgi:glutathione synthase/RimK-type ligase-like ATP-grasp enzyme